MVVSALLMDGSWLVSSPILSSCCSIIRNYAAAAVITLRVLLPPSVRSFVPLRGGNRVRVLTAPTALGALGFVST